MTQKELEKLDILIKRKEKADNLPLSERLKHLKEYADITAEVLELESKKTNDNNLSLYLSDSFINGLKFDDSAIELYVWNCFKELEENKEIKAILWKLRAIQYIGYRLKGVS